MEDCGDNLRLARASLDLKDAGILSEHKDYSMAAYFAQQAAEKSVKALPILNNRFERTHYVSRLLSELAKELEGPWGARMGALVPDLDDLEESATATRYPEPKAGGVWNPVEEYTEKDASDAEAKAKKICGEIAGYLKERYGVSAD